MSIHVLIIDDDERLNALLTEYLKRFGFAVTTATHPEAGLRALKSGQPDILILDVMLPEMDGFAVCRKVRESSRVPIIMLTARGDVTDRIVGLELGALLHVRQSVFTRLVAIMLAMAAILLVLVLTFVLLYLGPVTTPNASSRRP